MACNASRQRLLFSTASIFSVCMVGAGHAQTASASAAAAAPTSAQAVSSAPVAQVSSGGVGEVVVTAQKREQTLQKVPVAITAFTGLQRDKLGISSVQDMTNFTPGLVYDTGDDRVVFARHWSLHQPARRRLKRRRL